MGRMVAAVRAAVVWAAVVLVVEKSAMGNREVGCSVAEALEVAVLVEEVLVVEEKEVVG
jgi:hypothetical protein